MSGPPDIREADPRDRRDPSDTLIYPPQRIRDPLDDLPKPTVASVPNPHEPDPRDRRETPTQEGYMAAASFFFPSRAKLGQVITNTFGRAYQWDGDQWVESINTLATTYIFNTGLTEAPPGTVNLDPALPLPGEIGGINEPPADTGFQYTRSYSGGVGSWSQITGGLYTFGIGLDEVPPGSLNVDLLPATPTVIGGVSVAARSNVQGLLLAASGALTAPLGTDLLAGSIVEPLPDGLQYVRSRSTAGVSTWQVATTASLIWGIGIDEDTVTPGTIHLQPANFTPGEIGGITADVRSLTQGLLLDDATGLLTAPLATDLLAGSIVEPPPDDLLYVRQRTLAGVSAWVPSAAGADFGTGISLDTTTTPPIANLQPAGDSPATLGGVYVVTRARSLTEGLELGIDGQLRSPRATEALAGAFIEPPTTGIAHTRKFDLVGSTWVWEPALTAGLAITGLIPEYVLIGPTEPPLVVHIIGQLFTATTEVLFDGVPVTKAFVSATEMTTTVTPATVTVPFTAVVTVREGATPGAGAEGFSYIATEDGLYQGRWSVAANAPDIGVLVKEPEWTWLAITVDPNVPEVAPAALPGIGGTTITHGDHVVWTGTTFIVVTGPAAADYGLGLSKDETQVPPLVNLTPAGPAAQFLGGVWVSPQTATQGLWLDPSAATTGELRAPLATDLLAGSIVEPPPDDLFYVRQRTLAGVSGWVQQPPGADFGIGLSLDNTITPPLVNLQPAGDAPQFLGGVYVVDRARNVTEGLELGLDGRLRVPLATPRLAGSIVEPEDDGKGYVRTTLAGVSMWVPPADTPLPGFGIGLSFDNTTPPGIVNLQPAGDSAALLGGVYIVDRVRTATSGLELDIDGALRAPLATEIYAGTIVDPLPDALRYVRTRSVAGVSSWVPEATTDFGTGLVRDDTATPPIVHLQPAGDSPATLGGVYVIDRVRNMTEGLELGADGRLRVPPATDALLGGLREPPPDAKGYVRTYDGTTGAWVPPSSLGTVWTDDAPPAVPVEDQLWFDTDAGDLLVYINDGTSSQWVSTTGGGSSYVWGVGLDENTTTPGTIDLRVANFNGEIGGITTIGRGPTQGLELNTATGLLTAPLATHVAAGSIVEPPADGAIYSRQRTAAGVSSWVPGAAGVFIGDDPPPAPTAGMLWFESDTGDTHIWYTDADSSQWVQI